MEAGGTVGAGGEIIGRDEEIEGEEFFAEVPFIDGATEDGLIESLELGEGEMFWQEFEADGLVADFSA